MRPDEFLLLVAPLGIGLAGFSGLVSAFHPRRNWNPADFVRLQSLVIASFAVTFFALWPVVLLAVMDPTDVWRIASASHILYLAQIRIRRLRSLRRTGRSWRDFAPWYIDVLFYPLQVLAVLNVVLWGSFAPYAAAVVFQLLGRERILLRLRARRAAARPS